MLMTAQDSPLGHASDGEQPQAGPSPWSRAGYRRQSRWGAGVSIALHLLVLAAFFLGWIGVVRVQEQRRSATAVTLEPLPSVPPVEPVVAPPGPKQVKSERPQKPEVEQLRLPKPEVELPPLNPVKASEEAKPNPEPPKLTPPAPATTAPQAAPLPPRQAAGAPVEGQQSPETKIAQQTWENQVLAKVERSKRLSFRKGGRAVLRVIVDRTGRAASVTVAKSSGDAGLDQEALATVQRASPFPAPPISMKSADLILLLPVNLRPENIRRRR